MCFLHLPSTFLIQLLEFYFHFEELLQEQTFSIESDLQKQKKALIKHRRKRCDLFIFPIETDTHLISDNNL